MTHRTTLLIVCAFEIVMVLFVMAWPVSSDENHLKYEIASPPSCKNNLGEKVLFRDVDNVDELRVPLGWPKDTKQGHPLYIDLRINTPQNLCSNS